jgi:hypothetical protein
VLYLEAIIEGRLTAASDRYFLDSELQLYLGTIPLQTSQRMLIQHDGAPPHFSREVTEYMNANYQGSWTSWIAT